MATSVKFVIQVYVPMATRQIKTVTIDSMSAQDSNSMNQVIQQAKIRLAGLCEANPQLGISCHISRTENLVIASRQ